MKHDETPEMLKIELNNLFAIGMKFDSRRVFQQIRKRLNVF